MSAPARLGPVTPPSRLKARRVGPVLAVLLLLLGLPAALDVRPSVSGGVEFAVGVAVLSSATAVATLILMVPAWRGRQASAVAIAALQFVAVLAAVPAFGLPSDLVPAGGVLLAVLGVALNLVAVVLVALDSSAVLLWAAALTAVVSLYAALVSLAGLLVPSNAGRTVQTAAAITAALPGSSSGSMRRCSRRRAHGLRDTGRCPCATAMRSSPRCDRESGGCTATIVRRSNWRGCRC